MLSSEVLQFMTDQQLAVRTRFGLPHEYSHLVAYILTNPMINGEVLRLDAGLRQIHWPYKPEGDTLD